LIFFCETNQFPKNSRQFDNPLFFKDIFMSQGLYPIKPDFFYSFFLCFSPDYVNLKKNQEIFPGLKITGVSQFG